MAPKVNCNAQKLASIQSWFRKSRTVWNLKELEKQLPSVGSINNMQVKDYIQSLQDENHISCEKIGSGNWYWSFPSQHAKNVDAAHDAANAEYAKVSASVNAFKTQLDERAASIQQELDEAAATAAVGEAGQASTTRGELHARQQALQWDVESLRKELGAYSENDPMEVELMKEEAWGDYLMANLYSEDILAVESWFKKKGADDMVASFKDSVYADEWDAEQEMLEELLWSDLL